MRACILAAPILGLIACTPEPPPVVARAEGTPVFETVTVSRLSPGTYRDDPQAGAGERRAQLAQAADRRCPAGFEVLGRGPAEVDYEDIYRLGDLDRIEEVVTQRIRFTCATGLSS